LIMSMLAKEPEDRPADADKLADAADALRRQDTQAAIDAVPGMVPFITSGGFESDATQVIDTQGFDGMADTHATQVISDMPASRPAPPLRCRWPRAWPRTRRPYPPNLMVWTPTLSRPK